jgi:serine/threonine protein kinase/Tol biopolymer transport system component
MSIQSGSRIGVYEVTAEIGKGGMGVVFRARDTKLLREVALKVLPDHFAEDPDRLARLQREAQVLASLNHPNIAQIYGLEQVGDAGCIVMELVEGETVADRLKSGPMPLDEVLDVAKQIGNALAAAHEKGVVHRDLKPANIKITPDGTVKVLDFGLAKVLSPTSTTTDPSMLPTKMSGSISGAIVGTAAYMSPEQARGKDVDARTDIWAFGCVLYEMLTGRQAFEADNITDMFARIVTGQPDFNLLPPGTPMTVRFLFETMLNKNAAHRLQHVGDVRWFLDPKFFPTAEPVIAAPKPKPASGTLWILALVAILLALVIPTALYLRSSSTQGPARLMRLELTLPGLVGGVMPSPDAERLAYIAQSADGTRAVWIRPIGSETSQKLSGADNTTAVLWSPDGRYLGFIADGKLKKADIATGAIQMICDFAGPIRGLDWNRDGVILFAKPGANILARVSDAGGEVSNVTTLDSSRKETIHLAPSFLPDGKHFLYAIGADSIENAGIFVGSLDDPKLRTRVMALPERFNGVGYAPSGYLMLANGPLLTAQSFDPNRFTLSGKPILVADGIEAASGSKTGVLFLKKIASTPANKQLVWYDRAGKQLGQLGAPSNYGSVELSPSGDRAAVDMIANDNRDIWVIDVARGVPARITFDPAGDWSPSWSSDGTRLIFASSRGSINHVFVKAATGVGAEESISPDNAIPVSWSHDGRYIVFSQLKNPSGVDTWVLQMPERKASAFIQSPFDKIHGRLSPDGKWYAYATNETGIYQIVVQTFPDPNGGKWQISAHGGVEPKWRRDGRELYYLGLDGKLMAVSVKTERTFQAENATALFDTGLTVTRPTASRDRRYDVSPDGRFLFVQPIQSAPTPVSVLVNWTAGIQNK